MTKGSETFKNLFSFSKEEIKEFSESSSEGDKSFEKNEDVLQEIPKVQINAKNLSLVFESLNSNIETDEKQKHSAICEKLISITTFQDKDKGKIQTQLISLQKFERMTPFLDYIESSENFQGNYQNYVFQTLQSIVQLQKINFKKELNKRTNDKYNLSESPTNKKTLILDLDETLIHSNFDLNPTNKERNSKGTILEFTHQNEIFTFELFIRPGLQTFLSTMSENFEIFIFTASKQEYADCVIRHIDPDRKFISNCFYREDCIGIKDKIFIKDLSIFEKYRDLKNIIMLDNSMYSFVNQLTNGVLINSFYGRGNEEDVELVNVSNYLQNYVKHAEDVRNVNGEIFGFNDILEDIKMEIKNAQNGGLI